ncbi:hypothetical protein SODALDRAFT_334880 [Sodiomyces alkalinus F11]|uniref:Uncharacterized protein n=1 Tax=Sodiomyces alkalinus (strain CBS 110278 / VKM F-3762 / F11) TaxID=1314773 RepID=A0A3N2PQ74_SODAK|nr:hypothetical protein SODALDRAFT_334880 [Sodiomyces alkalinus F11]ROT36672.1 hypothetical protein SODALDRAFT_334880 [Sodiomyces alkalinus F11]
MQTITQPDGTTRIVWREYGSGVLVGKIEAEYNDTGNTSCFARTAGQFLLGQYDLKQYLDAILLHLKAEEDGGVHHAFDRPPAREVDQEIDLLPLHLVDIFAGAVKARLWTEGFQAFRAQEWDTLRGLAGLAWIIEDPVAFDRLSEERSLALSVLSAEAADVLIMVCYVKRHVNLFRHILVRVPVPTKSSFDWFEAAVVESRSQEQYYMHQHSARGPVNVELEAWLWTQLLNAGWIHQPVEWSLKMGLQVLAHQVRHPGPWIIDYASTNLDAFHAALGVNNLLPGLRAIGNFLSHCPSRERAEQYCTRFSPAQIATSEAFYHQHTGGLLVTIIESDHLLDGLRVELIRRVLEGIPGLDLQAGVQRPWAEIRD